MRSLCIVMFAIAALASGCKKNSDADITGTVIIDNMAMANGTIRFIPVGNTAGNGGTARTDNNGKYILINPQGLKTIPPGEYKVVLSKRLKLDGSEPDPNAPPIESEAVETLPGNWSDDKLTTLTVTVTAEKKSYDFTLTKPKMP